MGWTFKESKFDSQHRKEICLYWKVLGLHLEPTQIPGQFVSGREGDVVAGI